MPPLSAGLLLYKQQGDALYIFLGHPGGPYFRNKDDGNWTIPKGLVDDGEDQLLTAQREFTEETGITVSTQEFIPLEHIQYSSTRKILHAWAFEGSWDERKGINSNTYEIEWPPKSGEVQSFPELDRADWFELEIAKVKIHPAQLPFIDRLVQQLDS